jgi:subtilisin family serine protease
MLRAIAITLPYLIISSAIAGSSARHIDVLPDGAMFISNKLIVVNEYGAPAYQTTKSIAGWAVTGVPSVDELCRKLGVISVEPFYRGILRKPALIREVSRMYIFTFSGEVNVLSASTVLTEDPNIELAELYTLPRLHYEPDDPYLDQQWHLYHTYTIEAWDTVRGDTTRHSIIAIVDTGVNWEHDDLGPNIWVNDAEDLNHNGIFDPEDINFTDDDSNGFVDDVVGWDFGDDDNDPAEDAVFHGSGVASSASEATDNDILGAGMGFSARLMCLKWTDHQGNFLDPYPCIIYAADNGAQIINCSWGYLNYSQAQQDIINAVWEEDVLVIASAGANSNDTRMYPAAYEHVMAVTATDQEDHKAYFASYGTWIDICAPGVNIPVIYRDDYSINSGTSYSTAIVAGLAGLLRTWYPEYSNDEIQQLIENSADPIDHLNPGYEGLLGAGRINSMGCVTTGLDDPLMKPRSLFLSQNYPNPFNSATVLNYTLTEAGSVTLSVYNILGRSVDILHQGSQQAGDYAIAWDASDLPSGIYFARLKAGRHSESIKLLLLK